MTLTVAEFYIIHVSSADPDTNVSLKKDKSSQCVPVSKMADNSRGMKHFLQCWQREGLSGLSSSKKQVLLF